MDITHAHRRRAASQPARVTGSVDVNMNHVRNGSTFGKRWDASFATTASRAATPRRRLAEGLRNELECSLIGTDIVLGLALDATRTDFARREGWARQAGFADEFSVTAEDLQALPDAFRLAYLGRLVRTLAGEVGLGNAHALGPNDRHLTPAGVIRLLCGITPSPDLATSNTGGEYDSALIEAPSSEGKTINE